MSNDVTNGIANLAGVAVMGAVAMKTIDIVEKGSTRKGRKRKKNCKLL